MNNPGNVLHGPFHHDSCAFFEVPPQPVPATVRQGSVQRSMTSDPTNPRACTLAPSTVSQNHTSRIMTFDLMDMHACAPPSSRARPITTCMTYPMTTAASVRPHPCIASLTERGIHLLTHYDILPNCFAAPCRRALCTAAFSLQPRAWRITQPSPAVPFPE